ncbi:MAG: hypothetical protein LQ343_006243 [Gyalolechia ehrenbergii]|nr:MAG: hypothetical protein LQ343_006243 [Gyalolechia ehrenbergii]
MPKGRRRGRSPSESPSISQSASGSGSESEQVSDPPSPPRRRKILPQRGNARPPRAREPSRRSSIPGEYPQASDDEPSARHVARRNGRAKQHSRQVETDGEHSDSSPQRRPKRARNLMLDEEEKPGGNRSARHPKNPSRRPKIAFEEFDSVEHDALEDVDDEEPPRPRRRPTKAGRQPSSEDTEVEPRRPLRNPPQSVRRRSSSPVEFDPVEPGDYIEGVDDQMRQALAESIKEAQAARPSEEDAFEEQLRRVMEASKADAATNRRSPNVPDEEEMLLRIIEESQREHEKQEHKKARRERELAQQQEEEFARALKASQRAARASGLHEEEEELARAISLSEAAATEDVRRAAERMAIGRTTSTRTASWTESNLASRQRGPSEAEASPTTLTAPAEASPKPAVKPAKPKGGIAQSIREGWSNARKPSRKRKSTSQRPALNTVPENAIASSSATARPKASTNTQAAAKTNTEPPNPPTSQALISLREPPIKPETLISMCEAAFPRDPGISAALAASKTTYAISTVQNTEEVSDPDMAAAVALSLASHQENEDGALDIQDTGLDDPPPSYFGSEDDKIVNHLRYTSSDYRREQPGKRKPINDDILKIMRLYKDLLAFYAEIEALDANGKGKGKATLALPAPAATSSEGNKNEPDPSPPEAAESLAETSRPALRSETEIAAPPTSGANFMATLPPSARGAVARMQMQSQLVSQSKLPGSRPRQKPERHMRVMGTLPIVREDGEGGEAQEEGRMGRGTARKVKKDSGYRRSGLGS